MTPDPDSLDVCRACLHPLWEHDILNGCTAFDTARSDGTCPCDVTP